MGKDNFVMCTKRTTYTPNALIRYMLTYKKQGTLEAHHHGLKLYRPSRTYCETVLLKGVG